MSLLGRVVLFVAALLLLALALGCLYFFRYAMRIPKQKPQSARHGKPEKPLSPSEIKARSLWSEAREWLAALPAKEDWAARADDGKELRALFVPNGDNNGCVLLIHGWHGRHDDMAAYGRMLYEEKGYAMLLPHQRAHGQSGGRYTTMGCKESRDMRIWISRLVERGVKQIIILGVSMGAGTTMILSALDLPREVKCLVEDCGYTSVREEYAGVCGNMLGKLRFLAPMLVSIGSLMSKVFLGCWYSQMDPERSVARAKRPMLFIHGEEDTFVPYAMLQRNYNACVSEKCLLSVPGAGHAMALAVEQGLYEATLGEFVDQYINS